MNQPYSDLDVSTLYMLIGESVWQLQHLENALSTHTTLRILEWKKSQGIKINETHAMKSLGNQQKQVLGQLIGSAKKHGAIPKSLYMRFRDFLDERNWIIHKCVINEYLSLRNENNKTRLFNRINKFTIEARLLIKEVNSFNELWYVEKGYSLEESQRNAEKILSDAEKNN
ncbi:MAG: hypothetical protein PHI79_07500 [Sulfurovaceae bacterium]|nr:hypothetical protein [Sulfurovaceae bacterium]